MALFKLHYSPDGEGGGDVSSSEASASSASSGSELATGSTEGSGEDSSSQASIGGAAEPDYEAMHKAAEDGVEIPAEHLDGYEKWFANGMPKKETAQPEPPAPEQTTQTKEQQEALEAKEYYVKCAGDMENLLQRMAAGDQQALADFQAVTGKPFPNMQPAQPATPNAEPAANPWKITPEEAEAEGVMDMAAVNLFNSKLDAISKALDAKTEGMKKYEADLQERQTAAHVARIESSITDEIMALADAGRYGKVSREQIDNWRRNPADPKNALPEKFVQTMQMYADLCESVRDGKMKMSLADVDRLLYYREDIAAAGMAAVKASPQQRKPTVGVNGSGGAADLANLTPEQMQAMANGDMDIPDKFLDEDGMPIPGVCPKELTALLTGAA